LSDNSFDDPVLEYPKFTPLRNSLLLIVISVVIIAAFRSSLFPGIVGYLLTPFGVVFCLVAARRNDVRSSANPYYERTGGALKILGRTFMKRMQVVTVLAYLIGCIHIWHIASVVATR
jgi:hypothetical protein